MCQSNDAKQGECHAFSAPTPPPPRRPLGGRVKNALVRAGAGCGAFLKPLVRRFLWWAVGDELEGILIAEISEQVEEMGGCISNDLNDKIIDKITEEINDHDFSQDIEQFLEAQPEEWLEEHIKAVLKDLLTK